MTQGHDVDRRKVDESTWLCECVFCGERFESKRSDASFCSGKHRSAHHRHKVKMMKNLRMMDDLSTWIGEIVKCDHSFETVQRLQLVAARCKNGVEEIVRSPDYVQPPLFKERV